MEKILDSFYVVLDSDEDEKFGLNICFDFRKNPDQVSYDGLAHFIFYYKDLYVGEIYNIVDYTNYDRFVSDAKDSVQDLFKSAGYDFFDPNEFKTWAMCAVEDPHLKDALAEHALNEDSLRYIN